MSNALFTAAALGTVLFLYGIAGHFDEEDEEALAQVTQATAPASDQLLRLVCLPDGAAWPQSAPNATASKRPLVLTSYRTSIHIEADSALSMRCFITNE